MTKSGGSKPPAKAKPHVKDRAKSRSKDSDAPSDSERLQRFLARAGVTSRRKAEELITAGRVKVNGHVASELGTKVSPGDRVELDGRSVHAEEHVYLLMHKPRGYVTTLSDPEDRPTVMDLIKDVEERVYPVGRLDYNTEGVLVLTNDGTLAHALMHPSRGVEKVYHVKLRGVITFGLIEELQNGVLLDDGERTAPAKVQLLKATDHGNNSWIEVILHEGKNRQVHRMVEAVGFQIAKLHRVRYAQLTVEDLPPGRVRELLPNELASLRKAAGLDKRGPAPGAPAKPAPPRASRQPARNEVASTRHGAPDLHLPRRAATPAGLVPSDGGRRVSPARGPSGAADRNRTRHRH